jgi:hypothetical protein
MCIGVYWVGLGWILTWYGFKPTQSHPIHVDYHQNEQALSDGNGELPVGDGSLFPRGEKKSRGRFFSHLCPR